jgi:hypothetical protein
MIHALAASLMCALLLACVCRAARLGGLLSFLGEQWQAWLICRPAWLPKKSSGDCVLCTTFWLPGLPVAMLTACFTPAGPWAATVPFCVAVLSEILILL